jgi:hypothetical protein
MSSVGVSCFNPFSTLATKDLPAHPVQNPVRMFPTNLLNFRTLSIFSFYPLSQSAVWLLNTLSTFNFI